MTISKADGPPSAKKVKCMSDTKDTDQTETQAGGRKPLSLRRTVESGHVRQNFSHGRSKSVLVEKKRKRMISAPGSAVETPPKPAEKPVEPVKAKVAVSPRARPRPTPERRSSGVVLRTLTEEEKEARARALAGARVREAEEVKQAVVDAEKRAKEDALKREREELVARGAEEEARKAEEDAKKQAADASAAAATLENPDVKATVSTDKTREKRPEPEKRKGRQNTDNKATPSRKGEPQRRRGRLTISNALDDRTRQRSLASIKRKRERAKRQGMGSDPQAKVFREVVIPEVITIQELANRMTERGVELIKFLMKQGQMVKITDVIDADTAELLVQEFGHTVKRVSEADVEEAIIADVDDEETL